MTQYSSSPCDTTEKQRYEEPHIAYGAGAAQKRIECVQQMVCDTPTATPIVAKDVASATTKAAQGGTKHTLNPRQLRISSQVARVIF